MKNKKKNSKTVSHYRQFFQRFVKYDIRLEPYRRFQDTIFRVVVTNSQNSIVSCLGYLNPNRVAFRATYSNLVSSSFQGKMIVIDVRAAKVWLKAGALPKGCLILWFEYLGLLKLSDFDEWEEVNAILRVENKLYKHPELLLQNFE